MTERPKSGVGALLSGIDGPSARNGDDAGDARWRSIFWLYAAIIPGTLYAFDAIKITLYHVARAPNVNLITQLAVLLLFYGLWVLAPRLSWLAAARLTTVENIKWEKIILRLAGLGLLLSAAHLFLLTILLLAMHAQAAWAWEPIHILHAFGETWLGYAGLWLIAYGIASAAVLFVLNGRRPRAALLTRYEVRENGKMLSIPIDDIYWVKASGNYAELHTTRGVTLVRKTLSQIDREFGSGGFFRSHRGAIVNGRHVLAIKPESDGSGFIVQLANDEAAPLSRRKLSALREMLKSLA